MRSGGVAPRRPARESRTAAANNGAPSTVLPLKPARPAQRSRAQQVSRDSNRPCVDPIGRFAAIAEIEEPSEPPLFLARTRVGWARALVVRGQPETSTGLSTCSSKPRRPPGALERKGSPEKSRSAAPPSRRSAGSRHNASHCRFRLDASASPDVAHAPAWDDREVPRPTTRSRLLRPGVSERLTSRSQRGVLESARRAILRL